jgi:hypothetical protein
MQFESEGINKKGSLPNKILHVINLRVQSSGPNSELFSKDIKYNVPRFSIFKTHRNQNITFDSKIEKDNNVRLK